MAQFMAPPDRSMYGDLGALLGAGLGGLAQYGISEYQRPAKIDQFKNLGFSEPEAMALASMPPQQQSQLIQQKMKQIEQNKKLDVLGSIFGKKPVAPAAGEQISTMPQESTSIDQTLQGLGEREPVSTPQPQITPELKQEIIKSADQLTPDEIQQVLASGVFNVNEVAQIQRVLAQKEELEFKRKKQAEDRAFKEKTLSSREQAPIRKEIREEVKVWHKEAKKADKDLHALEELKVLDTEDFTPTQLRKLMTKAGFGSYFLDEKEEAYQKITEGLIMDKASELASAGKITAAIFDRVRMRYPSLENTPEGRDILVNILGREAEENKVRNRIYRDLKKKGKWETGKEPLDIVERVEDLAEPELKKMREKANEQLKKEIGYTENDEAVEKLSAMGDPSKMPEGRIAKVNGKPVAKIVNGRWQPL